MVKKSKELQIFGAIRSFINPFLAFRRKNKEWLPYILTPLLEETVKQYLELYEHLCLSEPENDYCKDSKKGFYNFLSDILQAVFLQISSFDSTKVLKYLNPLKSRGIHFIPIYNQDLGDGLVKENLIEKVVDIYLNTIQPKNLAESMGILNFISTIATITTQKDGICEELSITFKYKQEEEKEKDLVRNYAKIIASKMGYEIKGVQVDPTIIKLRCCK
ncbi:hypothetical protein [Acidianus sp. HS-5]|uniref:hypothetical protein n=1 Tax=Acidianus sp. HS-5 TaxID=2886040 RepID=UPI001F17B0B5|nr:hypothetical protein [Acidianus sp. HS-5]BDC19954.1 hypothetical protein HS5_28440 [Acidianus sp. HS-5]